MLQVWAYADCVVSDSLILTLKLKSAVYINNFVNYIYQAYWRILGYIRFKIFQ